MAKIDVCVVTCMYVLHELAILEGCLQGVLLLGAVRLAGRNAEAPHTGYVELYREGQWLPVLDSNWTVEEAVVVCRQLGYTAAASVLPPVLHCASSASGASGGGVVSEVVCLGDEGSLGQCPYNVNNESLSRIDPSGVVCAS